MRKYERHSTHDSLKRPMAEVRTWEKQMFIGGITCLDPLLGEINMARL